MTVGTNDAAAAYAQPVPDVVAAAATAQGLGGFREVYGTKKLNWAVIVINMITGIATCWLILGLWLLWSNFHTPNLSKRVAGRRVYVYDAGFVYGDGAGGFEVYRWDAISTVFQRIVTTSVYGVNTSTQYLYTITRADGQTVKLSHYIRDIARLGPHVALQVSRAQLPAVQQALVAGQGVVFGDMTVTAQGVTAKRGLVPWSEINGAKIARGYVTVSRQGKFLPLSNKPAAKIPNLPLFLALVEQYSAGARR